MVRKSLPSGVPGTHFKRLSRPRAHGIVGCHGKKIPSDTTGDRSGDLPTSSIVPWPLHQYIYIYTHRMSQEKRSIFWEVIVSVSLSKNHYMSMCPILNSFRDRAIWMETASHRFTCFRQWRSRVGGKDNTGHPSQTTILNHYIYIYIYVCVCVQYT
jgi:hypothetical protein